MDSASNSVDDYSYDANGNMTRDNNKNITNITYNHLNLPTLITFAATGNIVYIYNASGQKVQKIVNETGKPAITTDYLGGYQYNNGTLKFFPTSEGYVEPSGSSYKYVYQYKDHLGNIRLSYDKNLVLQEENNYYPFGLKHKGYNPPNALLGNNDAQKYKYNGKELQDEFQLNVYDYGGRNYDPSLGRWMNIDPKAELSRRWSPYNYAYNDPTRFTDPDGMLSKDAINEMLSKSADNKETKWTNSGNGSFTNGTDAVAANDEMDNFTNDADSGGDIDPPKKGQTGSYTNTHESGKKYHGKGPETRARQSGKRIAGKHEDPLVHSEWTPALDEKQAYKDEDDRIQTDEDGVKSDNNYNERNSPGKKIKEKEAAEATKKTVNAAATTGAVGITIYIIAKIVVGGLTWECGGCGALAF